MPQHLTPGAREANQGINDRQLGNPEPGMAHWPVASRSGSRQSMTGKRPPLSKGWIIPEDERGGEQTGE